MLRKNKRKQDRLSASNGQPSIFTGAATAEDMLAPSLIKEVKKGEEGLSGKATDYWVEVGGTVQPVRYFRSFFAALTGNVSWAGMFDDLYAGDFGEGDCDTIIHVRPTESSRVQWNLSRKIAGIESDLLTEHNSSRRSAMMQMLADLHEQQRRLRTNISKLYQVSIQVVASHTEAGSFQRFCGLLVKRFAGQSIILRAADARQLPALREATPLGREDIFKDTFRNMESDNVADLFPFGQGSISHRAGIVIGDDPQGRPIFFDNWYPLLPNYNMVIFGQSGAGKSVSIKLITSRSALWGIRTAIIDPELEYRPLVLGMGCPYIDLSPNSSHRINIFDVDAEEDAEGNLLVNLDEAVYAVQAVVFRMIRQVDPENLNGQAKIRIGEQIRELYASFGITEDPESLLVAAGDFEVGKKRRPMPTLSDLYQIMKADPATKAAANILRAFTQEGGSKAQSIFDGQSTVELRDAPIVAFSLAGLEENIIKPLGTFVATKWVWERFGKKNRTQKKRIIVDEAQMMMDDPETAKWLENAFRRGRKLNVSMCAVTQGFEVFTRVAEGMGILKNAPTKILLRQDPMDIDAVQGRFDLSVGEAQFLLTAPKGQGILRVDHEAAICFFRCTDREYAMFSTDPNELRLKGGGAA